MYEFKTDSEKGIFGGFILYRVRELFGVGDYAVTVPKYAEHLKITTDDLCEAIRGNILPPQCLLDDMANSGTMTLDVDRIYRYTVKMGKKREAGYKLE